MDDATYQLLTNVGDDLKSMADRPDKTIFFANTSANTERADAFRVLADTGVVTIAWGSNIITVELLLGASDA